MGLYAPGQRLLAWARAVPGGADLVSLAGPTLAALAKAARATAKLSVRDGDLALVVAVAAGPGAYSISTQVGRRFPLHAGAASKVLAAHLPEADRLRLLSGPLPRRTANTITDPTALAAAFEAVRRDGLATARAEYVEGVHALAAPVLGPEGSCLAAVSVAFLHSEPAGRIAEIEAAVRAAGQDLTRVLGG